MLCEPKGVAPVNIKKMSSPYSATVEKTIYSVNICLIGRFNTCFDWIYIIGNMIRTVLSENPLCI